jgi:hypothetical protein
LIEKSIKFSFFILLLLLLFTNSCDKKVERRSIGTGLKLTILKPVVEEPYERVEWYFQKRPIESKSKLDVKFDFVKFTPDCAGEYDIVSEFYNYEESLIFAKIHQYLAEGPTFYEEVSVIDSTKITDIDSSKNLTSNESFSDSILEKIIKLDSNIRNMDSTDILIVSLDSSKNENLLNTEPQLNKKSEKKSRYTVQVFSLPDQNQAQFKMKMLESNGFESYIVPFLHPALNETWYRVRVGKYYDYEKANTISLKIKENLNIETWIDRL